ncbi:MULTISPECIES: hypothetical protein [Rhizobium]|uniref:Nodulation protein n=1 Tax=Rhizobium wuzhouense TaxID=1986026 RepID=A0ABX5NVR4_9HYPH|nr:MULTISPECIES: hypothetical protein [Rhizobium]PYB77258.1 hypothetical protein DMY87_02500 [Rhizobium wuzhouense]RKE85899.1 hypothetical protein DFO46_2702 [Rhizobium sp. AG855]
MRIESGLSSNSYQSRYVPGAAVADDASNEAASTTSGRATGGASTFSSTLLSNQLASALWTVEGSRKPSIQLSGSSNNRDDLGESARLQMVEAAYREYEVPTVYDEF